MWGQETHIKTIALGKCPMTHDALKYFTLENGDFFFLSLSSQLDQLLVTNHHKLGDAFTHFHLQRSEIQNVSLDKNQGRLQFLQRLQERTSFPAFSSFQSCIPCILQPLLPSSKPAAQLLASVSPVNSVFGVKSLSALLLKGGL